MIHSKVTRIVGLKETTFKDLIANNQILCKEVRLIPALKTGDEGALTSIFLSALRLIKEFRVSVFKDIKMPRSGRFYYLREVSVPELSKSIVDGMIVCVKSGKVADAAIFEMKKASKTYSSTSMKAMCSI